MRLDLSLEVKVKMRNYVSATLARVHPEYNGGFVGASSAMQAKQRIAVLLALVAAVSVLVIPFAILTST